MKKYSLQAPGCTDPTNELAALQQEFEMGPSPPSNFSEGAQHTVRCRIGDFWLDGSSLKMITCISPQLWNFPKLLNSYISSKVIN